MLKEKDELKSILNAHLSNGHSVSGGSSNHPNNNAMDVDHAESSSSSASGELAVIEDLNAQCAQLSASRKQRVKGWVESSTPKGAVKDFVQRSSGNAYANNSKANIGCVAGMGEGKVVLSNIHDHSLLIYDAANSAASETVQTGHTNTISGLVYSEQSSSIVTASADGSVKVGPSHSVIHKRQ